MNSRPIRHRLVAPLGLIALGVSLFAQNAAAAPPPDAARPTASSTTVSTTAAPETSEPRGTDQYPNRKARAVVRAATARYQHVERAIDAGYVQFFGCVHEPLQGAMGIHFVNAELAGDTKVRARAPEGLLYEVDRSGRLRLLGVEYVVFAEAWDADHTAPPRLFGQEFHLVDEPNRYGLPAHYMLHAWAWKQNPSGFFANWNPRVLCPGTEGHN